ncbi:19364_t:CDS:10 [Gigaspora rosea]|nr:19364_t:CDS:10 [Gigaspora rosea]
MNVKAKPFFFLSRSQNYSRYTTNLYQTRCLQSIALRREDKSHWERRVALTPDTISRLMKETGVKAGAIVQEDISNADVILGIKEVPTKYLIPNKTYMFFSHTHKGQLYNMPMLQDILDKKIRLIDYELMTDAQKRRLVLFGTHAGYAGMIDGLHDSAKSAVKDIGVTIADEGLPNDFSPMTFVFTGTGNVSNGVQDIFKCLPHEYVQVNDLKECAMASHKFSSYKVYGCQVHLHDYLIRTDTGKFDTKRDYYENPQYYKSLFHTKIAPYTSMLIHGSYWDSRFPRLITKEQLCEIQKNSNNRRLLCVADISCDIEGALEFLSHSTTIDDPYFYFDAVKNEEHKKDEGEGTQIMAVDILPTEIPLESSEHFSRSLYPFIKDLVNGTIDNNPVLSNATIAKDGRLVGAHTKLYELLPRNSRHNLSKIREMEITSSFVNKPVISNHESLIRNSNISI